MLLGTTYTHAGLLILPSRDCSGFRRSNLVVFVQFERLIVSVNPAGQMVIHTVGVAITIVLELEIRQTRLHEVDLHLCEC